MWDTYFRELSLGIGTKCNLFIIIITKRYMSEKVRGSNLVMEHVGKNVT